MNPSTLGSLWLGVRRNTAKNEAYSSWGLRLGVGLSHEFGSAILGGANAEVSHTNYDERLAIFEDKREDLSILFGLWLQKSDWMIAGFSPSLRVNYGITNSSVGLYETDRWRAELTMVKSY